jgi:hypothetical protein
MQFYGEFDMQATSGEEGYLHGCAGLGGNGMMVAASCARRRKASFIVAATMSRSFFSAIMLALIASSSASRRDRKPRDHDRHAAGVDPEIESPTILVLPR